jgi:hypothetical protein
MLHPGGTLLATLPAVSGLAGKRERYADYWRFTPASAARLFGEVFGPERVSVRAYGNVLAAVAFLEGMACEELRRRELDACDERFPVVVAVRAVKG